MEMQGDSERRGIMKFTKMEGCGNDYVYIDGTTEIISQEKKPEIVRFLSDRHFGIGGDGVIFINPSQEADFEMEMYNADGTRAEMCGNGIRCVGKFVYDKGLTDKTDLTIISAGMLKYLKLSVVNGKVDAVSVNMGKPILAAKDVPAISLDNQDAPIINQDIVVLGKTFQMTCVSVGNPHAVIFVDEMLSDKEMTQWGPHFENHERFPKRINTEFIKIIDRTHMEMRVWERGTGETLACGTGATASTVAAILNHLTDSEVWVKLLGGTLKISWAGGEEPVYMTGPATTVFEGEIEL